jgi:hypothetical protein
MTVKTFSKVFLTIIAVACLLIGVQWGTQAISAANTMENCVGWLALPTLFFLMYKVLVFLWGRPKSDPLEYQCTCNSCQPESETKEKAQ